MNAYDYGRKFFVTASPWMLALILLFYVGYQIDGRITSAAYAYPRSVIAYGLTSAKTDEEVVQLVEKWKADAWGAQIGALRVLCENDRKFIESLGSSVGTRVCRIVK